jgi:hypothetical protein
MRAAGRRIEGPGEERVVAVGPPTEVAVMPPAAAIEATAARARAAAGEADAVGLTLERMGETAEPPVRVQARFEGPEGGGYFVVIATPKEGFKWNEAAPQPAIEATAPAWVEMTGPPERVESIASSIAWRANARVREGMEGKGMLRLTAYPCREDGSACLMVREEYGLGPARRP